MHDTDLYGQILGIESPWEVTDVELRLQAGEESLPVWDGWPMDLRHVLECL